jgi:plastocyanin
MLRNKYWIVIVVFCALFVSCNSKKSDEPAAVTLKKPPQYNAADVGSVSGVVKFNGPVPKPAQIDMAQDPACGTAPAFDESLVVNNGDLQNVFVYVKSGLNGGFGMRDEPVVIEQQGCRYHPHVLGALVGQTVKIVNADETTHNIHPMPAHNKQWNESQLPKAEPIEKRFNQPEIMIPIKCNQHAWMKMYLNVVDLPFFAVSGPDGKFEIKGLPPGEYTLAAVHEKLGEQDMKVTVGPKQSKIADFTFKGK